MVKTSIEGARNPGGFGFHASARPDRKDGQDNDKECEIAGRQRLAAEPTEANLKRTADRPLETTLLGEQPVAGDVDQGSTNCVSMEANIAISPPTLSGDPLLCRGRVPSRNDSKFKHLWRLASLFPSRGIPFPEAR